MLVRFLDDVRDLAEHADDVLAVVDRHGCDLDADPTTLAVDDHRGRIGRRRSPDDLPREELARALTIRPQTKLEVHAHIRQDHGSIDELLQSYHVPALVRERIRAALLER